MTAHPRLRALPLLLLLAAQYGPLAAAEEFASGESQVALIELFTSEGCSSCPPAERWLNTLRSTPGLWDRFVPIALHVDYWDYLGWKDPFAEPAHAKRQRRYAAEGGARTVYTPGVFRNGLAWSQWRDGGQISVGSSSPGNLVLRRDGTEVTATFAPTSVASQRLVLNVALLGMGFETRVHAGENRGRILHHDFVVLGQAQRAMAREEGRFVATAALPATAHRTEQLALVAWVSTRESQRPVQAVGGYLAVDSDQRASSHRSVPTASAIARH